MIAAAPASAPASWPYPHLPLDRVPPFADAADPAAWQAAVKPYFDAIYGPGHYTAGAPRSNLSATDRTNALADARAWRIDTRAWFDARYGPVCAA